VQTPPAAAANAAPQDLARDEDAQGPAADQAAEAAPERGDDTGQAAPAADAPIEEARATALEPTASAAPEGEEAEEGAEVDEEAEDKPRARKRRFPSIRGGKKTEDKK
jgi:hypothetical protein